jgi:hypothetical protein
MTARGGDRSGSRPDMLKLWTGAPEDPGPSRPSGLRRFLVAILVTFGAVTAVLLAKYAVDALGILLALLVAGLILKILGSRLAESRLLSPGWLATMAFGAAVLGYGFLAPSDSVAGLASYVPRPVVEFLEWSQGHGWGHVAFVSEPGPGGSSGPAGMLRAGGSTAAAPSGGPGVQPSAAATPGPGSTTLALSQSRASSFLGEPVYLTARLSDEAGSVQSVRFRDGSTVLGAADVRPDGQARVATLVVRGLSEGRHEITAELVGALALTGTTSDPLVHVVSAAGGR